MLDFEQRTIEKAPLMNLSDLSYCPGGVLPYVAYMGMCRWTGYGFWPLCPKQGI